jgi:hypothetical protein
MAKATIENLRTLNDALRVYQFDFQFVTNPMGITLPPNLISRIQTVDNPKRNAVNAIEIQTAMGHKRKIHGINDYTMTLAMAWVEDMDASLFRFFGAWQELIWETNTGIQHYTNEIQATCLLSALDSKHNPILNYTLKGVWLEEFDPQGAGFDGTSSEVFRPSVTLSYDYFTQEKVGR